MKFRVYPRYDNIGVASAIFTRPLFVATKIYLILLTFACCFPSHKYAHAHTPHTWLGSLPAQSDHVKMLPCRSVSSFLFICPFSLRWGCGGTSALLPHINSLLPGAPPGVKWMMKLQSGVMLRNVTALFHPGNQRASSSPLLLRWMI